MKIILICIALTILIALSAFFSSSEIALAKANQIRIKLDAESGDSTAKILSNLNSCYAKIISTILMGNNLVNIAAASVSTVLMVELMGPKYGPTVASVCITILLLIFGETVPKILAGSIPDRLARVFSRPLRFFMILFTPVVWLVAKLVEILSPLWIPKSNEPHYTTDELCEIVDDIEDAGVFSEDESDIIRSAIEFTETTANEILTPRVDVFALDLDEFDSAQGLKRDAFCHSLIPVYQGTIDNIVGILPVKRLLRKMARGETPDLMQLLEKPLYVHMTCQLSDMLELFRRENMQMAIVLDEFSGFLGIVTMEDVLEEIVGDIYDERDTDTEDEIRDEGWGSYMVSGGMNIYDLFDYMDWRPPVDFETEYTTVGGWVTELLDRFPQKGDQCMFNTLELIVMETEHRRVRWVRVIHHDRVDDPDSLLNRVLDS